MNSKKLQFITAVLTILAAIKFIPSSGVFASYNAIVSQVSDGLQYVIVNKADAPKQTCCFWNQDVPNPKSINSCDYKDDRDNIKPGRPSSCKVDSFENAIQEIRALIPADESKSVKLGVQTTIPYFNIPSNQSEQVVRELIKVVEEEEMPIIFKLDGITEWTNRADLWNWWDGNEANRENVEWTDWTPEAAIKISWRNWGGQFRVRPAPNLGSPAYIEAKKAELSKLLPIIANWYNSLPANKKYLLAGVVLDNELSLFNHYFYPDGNRYYDLCPKYDGDCAKTADDLALQKHYPINPSNGPSYGRQAIGYAAVKSFGIKTSGTLTQQDVDEAVKRHAKILAETAKEYLPADKVIIHGMWNISGDNPQGGSSYHSVVTNIVSPGWTTYGWGLQGFLYGTRFSKSSIQLRDAIKQNQLKTWGAVEWSAIEPADIASSNTFNNWSNSLLDTLRFDGNKLLVIYNLDNIRESKNIVVPAIQNIINGAPADPNHVPADQTNQFNFTQEISQCQANSKGELSPVVSLAWGKYKKALGYHVYKFEPEQVESSSNAQHALTKDELKFTDQYVLPGRTYTYRVQPIIPGSTQKPSIVTSVTVGKCIKDKDDPICQPFQKSISDQTGRKSCVVKPCQERGNDICSADDACVLSGRQSTYSCVGRGIIHSSFISSYGTEIENVFAALCQESLNKAGINLDSHLAVCKNDALIQCVSSVDIHELTGCVSRIASSVIQELTPGFSQVKVAEPTIAADRTPTQAFLQSATGEIELPISGGSVSFPTPDKENIIRLKVLFDKVDHKGSNELFLTFKVVKPSPSKQVVTCSPSDPEVNPYTWTSEGMDCSSSDPATRGEKWSCQGQIRFAYGEKCPPIEKTVVSTEPKLNEGCWQFERNECTGCGISRSVERYTCEGPWFNQLRVKPGTDGQQDNLCITSQPTSFFRYECTGCKEARRVEQYCNEDTFIAQENIPGIEECADRCVEQTKTSCEIEDLAYYCERDNIAVYKFRDTACQIQFSTVDCKNRGQICREGDCVNE